MRVPLNSRNAIGGNGGSLPFGVKGSNPADVVSQMHCSEKVELDSSGKPMPLRFTYAELEDEACKGDDVVYLEDRDEFGKVGGWYYDASSGTDPSGHDFGLTRYCDWLRVIDAKEVTKVAK